MKPLEQHKNMDKNKRQDKATKAIVELATYKVALRLKIEIKNVINRSLDKTNTITLDKANTMLKDIKDIANKTMVANIGIDHLRTQLGYVDAWNSKLKSPSIVSNISNGKVNTIEALVDLYAQELIDIDRKVEAMYK
jgi:hypothetical protein